MPVVPLLACIGHSLPVQEGLLMKTYVLSFADSIKHVPEHPERTAMKSLEWDVRYRVWTSRSAMMTTVNMQEKRAPRRDDWRPCKVGVR